MFLKFEEKNMNTNKQNTKTCFIHT